MKKQTIKFILLSIFAILLSIVSFAIIYGNESGQSVSKICCTGSTGTSCFSIEIADDDESRQKGLMFRESLERDKGMLFIFDDLGIYNFWMKNTIIPLAGIRINEDMKIVDIIQMNPCITDTCPTYTPRFNAKYVLEINQNLISDYNLLQIGNLCYIS